MIVKSKNRWICPIAMGIGIGLFCYFYGDPYLSKLCRSLSHPLRNYVKIVSLTLFPPFHITFWCAIYLTAKCRKKNDPFLAFSRQIFYLLLLSLRRLDLRQLDRAGGLARAKHRHHVRHRQRRELARQEVANLQRRHLLPEQQVELGAKLLRHRGTGGRAAASAAYRITSGSNLLRNATLTLEPRRGDQAALMALKAAGLNDAAVVALAQLVAFLSYQTRVVAGLRALAATHSR